MSIIDLCFLKSEEKLKKVLKSFLVVLLLTNSTYAVNKTDNLSNIQVTKSLTSMPFSFTQNNGQWDEQVKFRANAGGATMWFASDGAYYQFTRTIRSEDSDPFEDVTLSLSKGHRPDSIETMMIKANFVGANQNPQMVGVDMIDYKCNYFIGNDQLKWATDVPNFTAVMYEQIYDGIDLKYYGNGTHMEYDYIVEPGADFSQIKIQYEGAESIAVNDNGELVVTTMWGEVVEQRPIIYQIENSIRVPIDGSYKLSGASSFSFELADYNTSLPLIIDPVLEYSTYLGGSRNDRGLSTVVDNFGSSYITGYTSSPDFPIVNPYNETYQNGYRDIFVSKLNPTGNGLIFSTFIGGNGYDNAYSIDVDRFGATYITGMTSSSDFPTINALSDSANSVVDAFVTKLNSTGDSLVYSTYLGGSNQDVGACIITDDSGGVYITGRTSSIDFPLHKPLFGTFMGGENDAFVTKLSPTGSYLNYSTYIGGSGIDYSNGIAVDGSGNAYIVGFTNSQDLPTYNAFQESQSGAGDIFVAKLSNTGDSLAYCTYLGGEYYDIGYDICVDSSGSAYIVGFTASDNYPVYNPYQENLDNYGGNIVITKINTSGTSLEYSTYIGGSNADYVSAIEVDNLGCAYITGLTTSFDFPVVNAINNTMNGSSAIYITKFNEIGDNLEFSTFFGGTSSDHSQDIDIDVNGNIYITGWTTSDDFPVINPFDSTYKIGEHAFISKFSFVSTDIEKDDLYNLPTNFNLSQNYPNPFNPSTTIEFNLPTKSNVTINIYNLLGQEINQLVNQVYSVGNYKVTWDGRTSNGSQASTGIYLYRIKTDNFVETKKMLLLK